MRILHIIDFDGQQGGIQLFFRNLETLLIPFGFEFFYMAREDTPAVYKSNKANRNVFVPKNIYEMKKYIKEVNPQILHFHEELPHSYMKWCIDNYVTIRTFHDNFAFCPYGYNRIIGCKNMDHSKCMEMNCIDSKKYESIVENMQLQKEMNLVTYFSDSMRQKCIDYKFSEDKMLKIPSLLDKRVQIQNHYNAKEKIIIYAGRISEGKGLDYLLEALKLIDYDDYKLYILGSGEKDYLKKILRLIIDYNLQKKCVLLGFLNHEKYIELLRKAYIFIFPSVAPEGYGYTAAEARQYAVPIISFDVAGCEEWLINEYNGFIIENRNVCLLAQSIMKCLKDDTLWRKIKENAIQFQKEILDIELQVQVFLKMYKIYYNNK